MLSVVVYKGHVAWKGTWGAEESHVFTLGGYLAKATQTHGQGQLSLLQHDILCYLSAQASLKSKGALGN